MKTQWLVASFAVAMLLQVVWTSSAFATPCPPDYLFAGNDDEANLEALLTVALGESVDLTFLRKIEDPDTVDGGFSLSTTDWLTGDWTSPVDVVAVTVKAGGEFGVWLYDPAVQSGCWDTNSFRDPPPAALSHITFWGDQEIVPEASSILLWGVVGGVFGVGYWFRRRRQIPA